MRPSSSLAPRSMHPVGRLALVLSLAAWVAACGGPEEVPDAGEDRQDAGQTADAGEELPDAGEPTDAGEKPDGGDPTDGGQTPDAGPPEDGCGAELGGCDEGETCVFPVGALCGVAAYGTCEPTPASCPDLDEPQCGCDGNTYANACEAQRAGAGVSHAGECPNLNCAAQDAAGTGDCGESQGFAWDGAACVELKGCGCAGEDCSRVTSEAECKATFLSLGCLAPASCATSDECAADEYCQFPALDACGATMTGVCQARPLECGGSAGKVCGCDGEEYASECLAWIDGVAVEYNGPCTTSAVCRAQQARAAGEGMTSHGFAWDGESCIEIVGATCFGDDCGSLKATRAECEAAFEAAGCFQAQTCGGPGGVACDPGFYCDFPEEDACGLAGTCVPAPAECPDEYALVCGCDGQHYDNECFAQLWGQTDIAGEGPCQINCPAQDAAGVGEGSDVLGFRWDGEACVALIGTACEGSVDAGFEDCDWCEGADCGSVYLDKADCEYDRVQRGCLQPQPCGLPSDDPCPEDSYCKFANVGDCLMTGASGVCALKPLSCQEVGEGACGCDGTTYLNVCKALQAGVDVSSYESCAP